MAFPELLDKLEERVPVLDPTQAVPSHGIPRGVVDLHPPRLPRGRQNC